MAIPQRNALSETHGQPLIRIARVLSADTAGRVTVHLDGQPVAAEAATHLPPLLPGQRVAVLLPEGESPLITAAYPLAAGAGAQQDSGERMEAAIGFDPATGTLNIQAKQLNLQALGSVEIRCGEAVLRFTAQGNVALHAQAITQSAIGPYQIEGASIDLN